ncbi:hypothetical protein IZ6_07820 [Terrihabitans soli]|uniref:Uncharacterized protein n=1 Tax=Terrihabitans soli TaxID=708113 RepID=A0A6S6QQ20_9HYPH|nr:hypothetical protein [Terrihabitans soli]BCJ90047.1 hypothetical protein IZ6_07820 [Terrihabitans soli]
MSSAIKCFNTRKTCPVLNDFDEEVFTVRFSEASDHYPSAEIEALPAIENVSFTASIVSLGENLGTRASLVITFSDFPYSDSGGFDKYLADRPYNPYEQGTFFGKLRGRHRSLRGKAIRWIKGEVGQTLDQMEIRHFFVDSFEGPSPEGKFTITAKDALKFADDERSQAPRIIDGFLNGAIDADDVTAVLSPAGIGNEKYPAASTGSPSTHYFAIFGGNEVVKVTNRSGDTLTILRGQRNTPAVAHEAQDRVQLPFFHESELPEVILKDLLVNYCGLSEDFIPFESWQAESATKLSQVYTVFIGDPTGCNKLISELVQVCGLAVFWDDLAAQIRFQVLGVIATDAALFDRSNIIENTLQISDAPERRASQVLVYFAPINPLKSVEDPENYRSIANVFSLDAEEDYGSPAVKKIFARWIADFGRQPAERVGAIQLGRFVDPPRQIQLAVHREEFVPPVLGGGYQVMDPICLQDETGAPVSVPIQVTRLIPTPDRYIVEASEMLFTVLDDFDPTDRSIIIEGNRYNVDLRDAYNQLYPDPSPGNTVTCIIEENVIVGSLNADLPSFDIGTWPSEAGTATRSSGSPVLTALSFNAVTAGLAPGMFVRGTGIQTGSKIVSVDSSSQITLDKNAQSSGSGGAVTVWTVILNVINRGRFEGKGGDGGKGSTSPQNGGPGGTALKARTPFNLDNSEGEGWGGGGGGGDGGAIDLRARGGGGGAGATPGLGAPDRDGVKRAQDGTTESGGFGGSLDSAGGRGGDPGQPGQLGPGPGPDRGAGGPAGLAIDGVSYVNFVGASGDLRGAQTN